MNDPKWFCCLLEEEPSRKKNSKIDFCNLSATTTTTTASTTSCLHLFVRIEAYTSRTAMLWNISSPHPSQPPHPRASKREKNRWKKINGLSVVFAASDN